MNLHPLFETALGQIRPDRLKALLLWYASGTGTLETESESLQTLLEEGSQSDPVTCYDMLESLQLSEMVSFTLVNEFGPRFAQRQCFPVLVESITHRLASRHSL